MEALNYGYNCDGEDVGNPTDDDGCCEYEPPTEYPPSADFSGDPTGGYAPLTVDFSDMSTPGGGGPRDVWG